MFQVINGSREQEAYIESLPVLLIIEIGGLISLLGYYRENMGLIVCYLFILLASIKDLLTLTGTVYRYGWPSICFRVQYLNWLIHYRTHGDIKTQCEGHLGIFIPIKVKFIALFGSTRFYTDDGSDMGIYSYCLPLGKIPVQII